MVLSDGGKPGVGVSTENISQVTFHGGAIEGYRQGISVGDNAQVTCFGTYFEVGDNVAAKLSDGEWVRGIDCVGSGWTVSLFGCTVWLNYHDRFVNAYGDRKGEVVGTGNHFIGGGSPSVTTLVSYAYAWGTSGVRVSLTGDGWERVNGFAEYTMPNPVVNGSSIVAVPPSGTRVSGTGWGDVVLIGSPVTRESGEGNVVKIPSYREAPSMSTYNNRNEMKGALIYNSTNARVEVWNGSAWVGVGS